MAEPTNSASNASVTDLAKQLSEQTSRLVRQEVELAKAELSVKGKQVGSAQGCSAARASSGFSPSAPSPPPPSPGSGRSWPSGSQR
jgi:hypothetical protein